MATEKLLRLPDVERTVGYKRSTIYKLIESGRFPRPIALGDRASAWVESEIAKWVESRIAASRSEEAR